MAVKMTCPTCGTEFDCPQAHPTHECFGCDYKTQMASGAERFAPLSHPLSRLLETELSVDQTGGMVLCLHVPLPGNFYAWFSELGEPSLQVVDDDDLAGFGVYFWDDAAESDGGGSRWVATDLPYDAAHGRAVAEWAAPLLAQIAAEASAGATIKTMTVGEYHDL